jgi:hypothetical protein
MEVRQSHVSLLFRLGVVSPLPVVQTRVGGRLAEVPKCQLQASDIAGHVEVLDSGEILGKSLVFYRKRARSSANRASVFGSERLT